MYEVHSAGRVRVLPPEPRLHRLLPIPSSEVQEGQDRPHSPRMARLDTVVVTYISPSCVMGGDPFIIRGLNIDGTSRVFIDGIEASHHQQKQELHCRYRSPDSAQTMVDRDVYAVVTNPCGSGYRLDVNCHGAATTDQRSHSGGTFLISYRPFINPTSQHTG